MPEKVNTIYDYFTNISGSRINQRTKRQPPYSDACPQYVIINILSGPFPAQPTFNLNFCISFSLLTFSIIPPRLLSFSSNLS